MSENNKQTQHGQFHATCLQQDPQDIYLNKLYLAPFVVKNSQFCQSNQLQQNFKNFQEKIIHTSIDNKSEDEGCIVQIHSENLDCQNYRVIKNKNEQTPSLNPSFVQFHFENNDLPVVSIQKDDKKEMQIRDMKVFNTSFLHSDACDSPCSGQWMALLKGKKRFYFIHELNAEKLYRDMLIPYNTTAHSEIYFNSQEIINKAIAQFGLIIADIEEGDLLYFPSNYHYEVHNLTSETIGASNAFFNPFYFDQYNPILMNRQVDAKSSVETFAVMSDQLNKAFELFSNHPQLNALLMENLIKIPRVLEQLYSFCKKFNYELTNEQKCKLGLLEQRSVSYCERNQFQELTPKKKVIVLQCSYENSTSELKGVDSPQSPIYFYELRQKYDFEEIFLDQDQALSVIRKLANRKDVYIYLNLCDGSPGEGKAAEEVIEALEKFNLPYTGADVGSYLYTKKDMKMMFSSVVKNPKYYFAHTIENFNKMPKNMQFPMIVKHHNGYSSVGLSNNSVVKNLDQLKDQIQINVDKYGGALIEEFIEGREFTILCIENPDSPENPHVLVPLEILFPKNETFKTFDLQWTSDDTAQRILGPEENDLNDKLKQVAKEAFQILGNKFYARIDVRVNNKNEIYVLEVNYNCHLFYREGNSSSDKIFKFEKEWNHLKFLDLVIENGIKTHYQKNNHQVVVSQNLEIGGFTAVANRDINEGEEIECYKEPNKYFLVSRYHVENKLTPLENEQFFNYAYNLDEQTFITYDPDFRNWKHINHSCDPNIWQTAQFSLSVSARKPIKKGEPLTMDYSCYYAGSMEDFECFCGSANCRKVIRGTDYLTYSQQYGDHISHYIWQKAQNQSK